MARSKKSPSGFLRPVYFPDYGMITIISTKEYYNEDWRIIGDLNGDYIMSMGYTLVYSPSINAYCAVKLEENRDPRQITV